MTDWTDPAFQDADPAASMSDPIDFPTDAQAPAEAFGSGTRLNPAQQEILDLLGVRAEDLREYDASLRHDIRHELESGLAPLLDTIGPDRQLFVSKYPLAQVHGCEAKFLADRDEPFSWTPATARGTVSHKAVELSIHWPGEPAPLLLVDEAIASLANSNGSIGDYLRTGTDVELAELRAQSNERVAKFLECFPPLQPQWRPVTESAVKVELFERRIVLQGRVDLTLGHARGTTARKLLIDFKSGGFSPSHVDDLRFYALLETIRIGTPPRMLASYYLDTGRPHPETVTEGLLDAALQRTIDGATHMVELEIGGAPPTKRSGPACRWCPQLDECTEGRAFIDRTDDDLGRFDPDE